jgi:ComF family protein
VCLYQKTAASALSRFKYEGQTSLLEALGEVLVSGMGMLGPLPDVDLVVPVPLSWQGRWMRGFDQSHLLALKVGQFLGVKVAANIIRKRGTRRQVGLGARERALNAASSFLPGRSLKQIRGQRVLLFDDVYTTGATIKACARILSGEAANVSVLTLARAEKNSMENSESRH